MGYLLMLGSGAHAQLGLGGDICSHQNVDVFLELDWGSFINISKTKR